jgi:hypothetical protein
MTAHDGRDLDSQRYFLEHRVAWPDVWAGLLLVLLVGTSAVVAAVLSSAGSPMISKADQRSAHETHPLAGVQDPRRIGWRPTNGHFGATGLRERVSEADESASAESGRDMIN